jgi:predicted 2-oxoglutarate/Fe(II)-dependent dioxygenase YbiX
VISFDLRDYVRVYENFLHRDLCNETVESLKKANWTKHTYYNSQTHEHNSYENDLSISYDLIPQKEIITNQIWNGIERYIIEDHAHFSKWYSGWNGYSEVRFNKYDKNTEMRIHCDHIHSIFDGRIKGIPVLSVLGALNNDYDGGEFVMWGNKTIQLDTGSLVIFPSNFLYPHHVNVITKGIRYSFVSWVF